MIFDLDPSQAQKQVDQLRSDFASTKILTKTVDVTDDVAVTEAVAETVLHLGSVDVLLCFAGVVECTHAIDMKAVDWRRTLDINTTGTFFCAQAVAREMIKQGMC